MAGIFNTEAIRDATQTYASKWQIESPHSRYWQDIIARILYSQSVHGLSSSARSTLGILGATAQNTLLESQAAGLINFNAGNPVADYTATHRAFVGRPLPITAINVGTNGELTDHGTSMSYGPGNNSLRAALLAQQAFAAGFRNENNQVLLHRTKGVSSRSVDSWLPYILEQPDMIKPGHFKMFNLSQATTGAALETALKAISDGDKGATKESLADLEPVVAALKILDKPEHKGKKSDADLRKILEDSKVDPDIIDATLRQRQGKNTAFLTQTKELKKIIRETFEAVGENLKDLSDLFETEDPAKIIAYAKGAGLGNVLDKSKAAEVRSQLREIATAAAITGQSPQEVVRDRIQIANGLSALYGGRVADKGAIDVVHNALITAQAQGDNSPYTKEEAAAAAVRSVANTQNLYSGAIIMKGVLEQAQAMGGVDESILRRAQELQTEFNEAGIDDKPFIAMKMESFVRKNFGDQVVDNPALVNHFMSKHGSTFLESHFEDITKDNIQNRIAVRGITGDQATMLQNLALQDVQIFGSNRDKSAALNKLIAGGDEGKQDAIATLRSMGMSKTDAEGYVETMSKYGVGNYASDMGVYLWSAEWLRQDNYSLSHKAARETVDVSRMLGTTGISGSSGKEDILGILSGELTGGNLTTDTVAASYIGLARASALSRAGDDEARGVTAERLQNALATGKLSAVSFGKYNAATGSYEFAADDYGKKQRKALGDLLGTKTDAELQALLDDPAALESALNAKGYSVAGAVGIDGEMYAYSRANADALANEYSDKLGGGLAQAFTESKVSGVTYLNQDDKGAISRRYKIGDKVYTEKTFREYLLSTPEGFNTLYRMAATGDKESMKLLSGRFKATLQKYENDTPGENSLPEEFAALLNKELVTIGGLKDAANKHFGVSNFAALGSGDLATLEKEKIIRKEGDKYVYNHGLKVGSTEFKAGDTVNAKALMDATQKDGLYRALKAALIGDAKLEGQEELNDQIAKIAEYLESIKGNMEVVAKKNM